MNNKQTKGKKVTKKGVGVFCEGGKKIMFYYTEENGKTILKVVFSDNAYVFSKKPENVILTKGGFLKFGIDIKKCSDFNFSRLNSEDYFLTYVEKSGKSKILHGAMSNDLKKWDHFASYENIHKRGVIVPDFKYDGRNVMYFGDNEIQIALSSNLKKWKIKEENVLSIRKSYFDNNVIYPGAVFLRNEGIVLFYYAKSKTGLYSIGVVLLDKDNPESVIYRSSKAVWKQSDELRKEKVVPIGITSLYGKIFAYFQINNDEFVTALLPQMWHREEGEKEIVDNPPKVQKSPKNPILGPGENAWETDSAFNPTALVTEDNKVHILYRAIGNEPISVLGCAVASNGLDVDKKKDKPIYIPRKEFEGAKIKINPKKATKYMSGGSLYTGGCGGVEDARIAKIDNRYYLTYVAYDGIHGGRVAISSISIDDYNNERWDKWKEPALMSRPGVIDKSACLLPEKVNGKYVIFHRIYPNILVDYVDTLDFDGKTFLKDEFNIPPRPMFWDSKKVAIAASPIKTKYGWLAIYLAVGRQEPGRYKAGAMLLDLDDPKEVICRTSDPLIEPDEWYENNGHKDGVVYPCGAVIHNGKLFIYYGGSDKYTCVAYASADEFLQQLVNSNTPKMSKVEFA